MKLVLNNSKTTTSFKQALDELVEGADSVSLAVSYIQTGGWQLFQKYTSSLSFPKMRIVCTDQMGITHPRAVRSAIGDGAQIRNFTGKNVFHPKVYLAYDKNAHPIKFLLGSANLSSSAFSFGVEAGVIGDEKPSLSELESWFNKIFTSESEAFTPQRILQLEEKWKALAAARALSHLEAHRKASSSSTRKSDSIQPEDLDTLEDVFATVRLPIGLLNIDYAANNVRNIEKIRQVLTRPAMAHGKQQSELKLLGLMQGGTLTELGRKAVNARSDEDFASIWCGWLQTTPDATLRTVNAKLLIAKRVFPQFWKLKSEVRTYFLNNAQNPTDRKLLQTIEFLCNAQDIVQELSLDDFKALSSLLDQPQRIPEYIRHEVTAYFDNKGNRSWGTPDRRTMPNGWKVATGQ